MTAPEINGVALNNLHDEIELIVDEDTRLFTSRAVLAAPGKYWIRPSATHEGHHPDDEHGTWGNLIHVKRVIIIAQMFAEASNAPQYQKDFLYGGSIIHDIGKYGIDGDSDKIVDNHPDAVRLICKNIEPCRASSNIFRVAETHMGKWGVTPVKNELEQLGHYSDYIASRTEIHIPITLEV